jgi:hypothetical protein
MACSVTIVSKKVKNVANQEEKNFGAMYSIEPISYELIEVDIVLFKYD